MGSADERIGNVKFEDISSSPYLKPIRMHFDRQSRKLFWDLAIEKDSVTCIIFHKAKDSLLFVKQFRPPVFIRKVRGLPENEGKKVEDIKFENYPLNIGETIELCAGLMDKPNLGPLETVQEEILEECGYKVEKEKIKFIRKNISNVSISGSFSHLFYTAVDESEKVSEGGGNAFEGEFIQKVFLTIEETREYVKKEETFSPPGFLYAVNWFLDLYDKGELPEL
ncbi:hypothetical protein FO519_001181 [Halicephalobus sp. NKZ332]|nr:hypothetical protein FO519_001181 [Halicephalobus sp. NKZ332]